MRSILARAASEVEGGSGGDRTLHFAKVRPTPLGTSKAGAVFEAAGKASAIYEEKSEEWMCTSSGR